MLISLLIIALALVLTVVIFIRTAPQMGKAPDGEHLELISQSSNYGQSGFINQVPTGMAMDSGEGAGSLMYEWLFKAKNFKPSEALPTAFSEIMPGEDTTAWAVWYGHSTLLVKMESFRILIDPVFGPAASPVPIFTRRFKNQPRFGIKDIPEADLVLISHDHYDHLDYPTIRELSKRDINFIVPLGVGSHLQRWGIEKHRITEMDWWESEVVEGIEFTAAPARHFSGRSVNDRNNTLWASWAIKSPQTSIYFSGDGGYSKFFREIGEKLGPFDLCFIECGQYNYRWKDIHLMPEETVQASIDVRGRAMVPIHWGAFNLAPHTWKDPVERAFEEAMKLGVTILTPKVGERIMIKHTSETEPWWSRIE